MSKLIFIWLAVSCVSQAQDIPSYSIESGGRTRTYLLYVPAHLPAGKVPLVISLHGSGGRGVSQAKASQFHVLAEKKGFLVAYPDGYERTWNDGRGIPSWASQKENIDDIGFLTALIDRLIATRDVDPKRVFVTGISNGGLMSHKVGCEMSQKVAAIAPVVRTMTVKIEQNCHPARPVPAMLFYGTKDPLVPFEGGDQSIGGVKIPTISADATIRKWAALDGCEAEPKVTEVPSAADPAQSITVRKRSYTHCRAAAEVIAYIQSGAGHTWPGGDPMLPRGAVGLVDPNLHATAIIWDFFEKHPLRE